MVVTLAEFLLARIAEDEQAAERVELCPYFGVDVGSGHVHLSRGRVLAECEAKRRIVELADPDSAGGFVDGWWEAQYAIMQLLALPFADHSDYCDEWRPEVTAD